MGKDREDKGKLAERMRVPIIAMALLVFLALASLFFVPKAGAASLPEGPVNISVGESSSALPSPAMERAAEAGNVTQINIAGSTVTKTWQGYYGNITGTITLEDSSNHTLINWDNAAPSGEIYAANSTIDFSSGNIECYDFTRSGSGYFDLASYESGLGLLDDSGDGVNETFVPGTTYGSFYAGLNKIEGECPETQLFNASGVKSPDQFQEVLLYDKSADNVVYTAKIQDSYVQGFDGRWWNFEMIVGVNGHSGNNMMTYYFYVELE